jgi:formate-dependent nitrite reductase membrane component NrfD
LIAIAFLVGFGILHLTGVAPRLGLPAIIGNLIGWLAVAGALVVMFYQGMAMSDSESLTLWASPLVPVASFLYALTAGTLLTLATAASALSVEQQGALTNLGMLLLVADFLAVCAILLQARSKSPGGRFSVGLLTQGEYAQYFIGLTFIVGFILPIAILALGGAKSALAAAVAMLAGFLTFRILMLKAAVYEPIMRGDLIASLGLGR